MPEPSGGKPLQRTLAPVHLLTPVGQPLEAVLGAAHASLSAAAAAREARRRLADATARDVLAALQAAHERRIVHCDVRPQNVVWAGGRAVLVDWGVARRVGDEVAGVGVEAYALARVFAASLDPRRGGSAQQGASGRAPAGDATVRAGRHVDLAAVAYLWLSIAFGGNSSPAADAEQREDEEEEEAGGANEKPSASCSAPWLSWDGRAFNSSDATSRDDWLRSLPQADDPAVEAVVRQLRTFEAMADNCEHDDKSLLRRLRSASPAAGPVATSGGGGGGEGARLRRGVGARGAGGSQAKQAALNSLYRWPWSEAAGGHQEQVPAATPGQ